MSSFCLPDYGVFRYTDVSSDKPKVGPTRAAGRGGKGEVLNLFSRVFQAAVMSGYRWQNNSSLAERNSPLK